MRGVVALLLLAVGALAQAPRTGAKPWRDEFWDVGLTVPGLEPLLPSPEVERIYEGRADGDVRIVLSVIENAQPADAKAARAARRAEWEAGKRALAGVREEGPDDDARLWAEETRYEVFTELHGYRWVPRGFHVFELHAWVRDRHPESEGAIRQALDGLRVGPRDDASLLARRIGLTFGRPSDDPEVLAEAGIEYATGQRYRVLHTTLARRMFERAKPRLSEAKLEPHELWRIQFNGGLAYLGGDPRDPATAVEWLLEAEKTAATLAADQQPVERKAQSAYNLACAASLAGNLDLAFAALERAYAEIRPVTDSHISDDRDLENCRKDPRWEPFWMATVKGKG